MYLLPFVLALNFDRAIMVAQWYDLRLLMLNSALGKQQLCNLPIDVSATPMFKFPMLTLATNN